MGSPRSRIGVEVSGLGEGGDQPGLRLEEQGGQRLGHVVGHRLRYDENVRHAHSVHFGVETVRVGRDEPE